MTSLLVGGVAGLLLGLGAGLLLRRGRDLSEPPEHLSDQDRADIERDLRSHSTSVARGISRLADELAGDDPELRQRLRRFEWTGR